MKCSACGKELADECSYLRETGVLCEAYYLQLVYAFAREAQGKAPERVAWWREQEQKQEPKHEE